MRDLFPAKQLPRPALQGFVLRVQGGHTLAGYKSRCEFLDNWLSESEPLPLQLAYPGKGIHEIDQGQVCWMGAIEDRLLDVCGQQDQA